MWMPKNGQMKYMKIFISPNVSKTDIHMPKKKGHDPSFTIVTNFDVKIYWPKNVWIALII